MRHTAISNVCALAIAAAFVGGGCGGNDGASVGDAGGDGAMSPSDDAGGGDDGPFADAAGPADSGQPNPGRDGGSSPDAGNPGTDGGSDADAAGSSGSHGIMIILMENHGYHDIIGDTADAPYINGLATSFASATAWSDVNHPSLPNYLALTSGSFYNDPQDCIPTWATPTGDCTFHSAAANLADQLTGASISWKAYMEDLPSACDTTDAFGPANYDVNHDPFVYYDNVVHTPSECNNVVPYTELATDLAAGALPTFVWVTPNLIHDMHDGTIADGDTFLKGLIPTVQASSWYQQGGSIILTWDEGETEEQIVAIVVSKVDAGHGAFATTGNHFGTLRAIEEFFGLPLLGSAADATNGDLRPLLQ